jgi:hypothetical protein
MEGFWSMIAREDHQQRNTIPNPIIQVFNSYVQKDFGEDERNKDNQHGVELALLGFDCQIANRPHSPYDQPVELWQHRVQELLVRGVTSLCWLSL